MVVGSGDLWRVGGGGVGVDSSVGGVLRVSFAIGGGGHGQSVVSTGKTV